MNTKRILSSIAFLFILLIIYNKLQVIPNPIFLLFPIIWYLIFSYIENHSKFNYVMIKTDRFKFDNM